MPMSSLERPDGLARQVNPDAQEWKQFWFRHRAVFGIVLLVPLGTLVLATRPAVAGGTWLSLGLDLSAWTVFLVGATLRLWATLYVGGRKRYTLVAEGPYSMCRNPLYLGSFLLILALAIFLKSLVFGAGVAAAAIAYMTLTVPIEERSLLATLGQEYADYCSRVPRYWPNARKYWSPRAITVDVPSLTAEMRRALGWVWLPFAGALIAHLRVQPWWPQWLFLP